MRRAVLSVAVAAGIAGSAVAQELRRRSRKAAPSPAVSSPAMDSAWQLAALSAIEPLGGEIDAQDVDAAEQWARAVGEACADAPDKLLAQAAREALGGD